MKKLSLLLPYFAAIIVFWGHVSPASGRIYLDITSPEFQKLPIAVPYFMDKMKPDITTENGREMARVFGKALEFHGFIRTVPPEMYGGKQDVDWARFGVDYVVLAQFDKGAAETVFELRFMDVQKNEMLLGRRYRGPWEKRKNILFRFCDEIIQQLTGEPGVSMSRIAFVSDRSKHKEIYVTDILGEEVKQITSYSSISLSPRFSPDASELFFTSYYQGNPNLYSLDLMNKKNVKVISKFKGLNMAPAVAPDGRKMVVTLSKDENPDLYLMSTNGTILRQLTKFAGINVSPSWSPDGKQIVFVSDRSGSPQIYIMDIDDLKTRRLTYLGGYNTSPSWSPKGNLIAYASSYESNYHIFTITADGAAPPTKVTSSMGDHESPSWSPDGRQIVFSRHLDNTQQICKILVNGSEMIPILRMSGNQSFPQWSPRLGK